MLIYRLEDSKTGEGAYRGNGVDIMYDVWENKDYRLHPVPYEDSALCRAMGVEDPSPFSPEFGEVHYGFATVAQFRQWFYSDEILLEFACVDYVLAVYEVPTAYYGNSQATFPSEFHHEEYVKEKIDLMTLIG